MHVKLLEAVIASVRRRHEQGDCPIEPAQSLEMLEFALLDLADAATRQQPEAGREGEVDKLRGLVADMLTGVEKLTVTTNVGGDERQRWHAIRHDLNIVLSSLTSPAATRLAVPTGVGRDRVTRTDIIREWVGGERYARDYEYCDATFGERADRILSLLSHAEAGATDLGASVRSPRPDACAESPSLYRAGVRDAVEKDMDAMRCSPSRVVHAMLAFARSTKGER